MTDTSLISELRNRTGCGIRDCKKALTECEGDLDKAIEFLRKKGLAAAGAKSSRTTDSGQVFSYIHAGGFAGVLLELSCETDFVGKNEQFQALGKDLCMHICALSPLAVSRDDIPADVVEKEKAIYREQMKDQLANKPEEVQEKILAGKLEKFYKENVLLEQDFVRDDKQTVEDVIKMHIATIKENIVVKRFARFAIGE